MEEDFQQLVNKALADLPQEFKEKLDNVVIFVEDLPTREQVMQFRLRERYRILLGLYEGIPQTKRGIHYGIGGAVPDKITLFRYPILSLARSKRHLSELVKDTLYHEIGHHFGMSEEDIENAKAGK